MISSVAVVGPDGAGKTTVCRVLEASGRLRCKYLYMGINIDSSNVALPSWRVVNYLKRRHRVVARGDEAVRGKGTDRRGRSGRALWATARLVHRVMEEWFRQGLSWLYQLRGYIVLYDRHFLFDYSPEMVARRGESFDRRLHVWLLAHLYPRPDLVIYLDAPAEVLYARKGESTPDELERRRRAFLRTGTRLPNFVCVNCAQPLEEVCSEVETAIMRALTRGPAAALPSERRESPTWR